MLSVVVHELPSTQGSKKSFTDASGHQRTVEDNRSALMVWRGAVAEQVAKAREAARLRPLEGPVVVAVTFTMAKPVSKPKRKPCWPTNKRDIDKLERAVFDALTIGGAFGDDGQVAEVVRQAKWFPLRDAEPVYTGTDAAYMMTLAGTTRDVMDHPGAVIRVAHYTELPSIGEYLAAAGYEPKDIPGGS
jgi:Holliday junction resolvase RusA-like endonuclease